MEYRELTLKRNGKGYFAGDYIYTKRREKDGIISLRCLNYSTCSATAKLRNELVYPSGVPHSHEPHDPSVYDFRAKLVSASKNPVLGRTSIGKLFESSLNEQLKHVQNPLEMAEKVMALPNFNTMRSTMARARSDILPPAPKTLADISQQFLLANCLVSDGASSFLISDSQDPERILVFGNLSYSLQRLAGAETVFIDGTFFVVPTVFEQLFTFHVFICGQVFPVLYVLLPRKTEAIYVKMWRMIAAILAVYHLNLQAWRTVVSDFEAAIIASVRNELPHVVHRGCFFHFGQCIFRSISSAGLRTAYTDEPDFRALVQLIIAMGLVPSNYKMAFHGVLSTHLAQDQRALRFYNSYFVPNWLHGKPASLWDWHNVQNRTNNHAEGWHSGIKRFFNTPHLSTYKFIFTLLEEEKAVEKKIMARIGGAPLPPVNSEYARSNDRLMRLFAEFPNRAPLDYLMGCRFYAPEPQL